MIARSFLFSRGASLVSMYHIGSKTVLSFLPLLLPLWLSSACSHHPIRQIDDVAVRITSNKEGVELEAVLEQFDEVLDIRIIEAEVNEFEYDGEFFICGLSYTAVVQESIRNTKELTKNIIRFESSESFSLGGRYIAFLYRYEEDRYKFSWRVLGQPTSSNSNLSKEFWDCREKLPLTYVRAGYQFWPYYVIRRTKDDSEQVLLIQDTPATPFVPKEVEVIKNKCYDSPAPSFMPAVPCNRINEESMIIWSSLRQYLKNWQPKQKTPDRGRFLIEDGKVIYRPKN